MDFMACTYTGQDRLPSPHPPGQGLAVLLLSDGSAGRGGLRRGVRHAAPGQVIDVGGGRVPRSAFAQPQFGWEPPRSVAV